MTQNLPDQQLRNALRRARRAWDNGVRYYDDKHRTYNPCDRVTSILEHVSDLCGMHGVLAYEPGDSNPAHPDFEYINAGDTYAATLVYSHRTGRFNLTTIGDIIEREEWSGP